MKITTAFRAMRIPFLALTPISILLGASAAIACDVTINWSLFTLVMIAALMAHISVNLLNEYFDFRSGLDFHTEKTFFSGGSGALPDNPEQANQILTISVISLLITVGIGIYFVHLHGAIIATIGLLGLLLITTYTGRINRHPFLSLIAPGLGFGFIMVLGTQYILQGAINSMALLLSAVSFFLVNNLLLLNQYPDIEADAKAGRRHFPIAFGITRANRIYALFSIATISIIIYAVNKKILPEVSLLAILPMPLAFIALYGAHKYQKNLGKHPGYLAANVAVTLLTPLVLGVSVLIDEDLF